MTRSACRAVAESPLTVDPVFTRLAAHEQPRGLGYLIQQEIDKAEEEDLYLGILLGFGLCGNAVLGLKAKTLPIIIPRAHDCCTLFLGSRDLFGQHFGHRPSAPWGSSGYRERGHGDYLNTTDTGSMLGLDRKYQDLVEQYGEENASFIMETLKETEQAGMEDSRIFIHQRSPPSDE